MAFSQVRLRAANATAAWFRFGFGAIRRVQAEPALTCSPSPQHRRPPRCLFPPLGSMARNVYRAYFVQRYTTTRAAGLTQLTAVIFPPALDTTRELQDTCMKAPGR